MQHLLTGFTGQLRAETGVLQSESGVESRNSRSDDSDVCHVSSPLEAHESWMHIRHEDALTGPGACSPAG